MNRRDSHLLFKSVAEIINILESDPFRYLSHCIFSRSQQIGRFIDAYPTDKSGYRAAFLPSEQGSAIYRIQALALCQTLHGNLLTVVSQDIPADRFYMEIVPSGILLIQ